MGGEGIWVHVKALIDGLDFKAPLDHVQDFEKVERELRDNIKRKEYLVFYSPKEKDTPESVRRSEGRVIIIDDLDKRTYASELKKPGNKCGIPGWYKAKLLQWEESVEDLNSVVSPSESDNLSRSSRSSARMHQLSDAKQSSKSNKRGPSSRNQVKIAQENGRKQNLKSLIENDDSREQSASSGDELGEEFAKSTVQRLKLKCANQAEEIKALKAALKRTEDHCSNLVRLNNMWQEKELNRKKSGSSSSSKHKSEERFHPYQKSSTSQREKIVSQRSSLLSEVDSAIEDPVSTDSLGCSDGTGEEENTNNHVDSNTTATSVTCSGRSPATLPSTKKPTGGKAISVHHESPKFVKTAKLKPSKGSQLVDVSEEDFMLNCTAPEGVRQITYAQFQNFIQKAKGGSDGDSQFLKECMGAVWHEEELALRSAVGGFCAVQRAGDKLPLTPLKKNYIIDVLK